MNRVITNSSHSVFKTQLNSNLKSNLKTELVKTNSVISTNLEKDLHDMDTTIETTSTNLDIDTTMNNSPEDTYFDEIIYYDGGGVEGYGD